jgi:hypothetical protein
MARIYKPLDNWLSSLGIAFLALSLAMVPANGILANNGTGDGGGCTDGNCNTGGCKIDINGRCPIGNDPANCNWATQGCLNCGCFGCSETDGTFCGCQCGSTRGCMNNSFGQRICRSQKP